MRLKHLNLNTRPIVEALKDNLIAIKIDLDPVYGMPYILKDTSNLPNGPAAQINLTPHPTEALAAKVFMCKTLPEAPFLRFKKRRTKYNNITAAKMYNALCDYTPPSLEDRYQLKL